MNINKRKQNLLESFRTHALKYEGSIRYIKSGKNRVERVLYSLKTLGLSYVMYNLSRLRVPGIFGDIRVRLFFGKEMIWPVGDVGANVFSMYGVSPHKSERKLALWIIKNIKDSDIFYDIGAHLGYYTALSEEIVVGGEVHAFEANNILCKYLKRNFSDSKNVFVSCTAIADSVGEVDFYDATNTEDSSASSRFRLSDSYTTSTKVTATTLDEYLNTGKKAPTVMKFDIEGGEYDAILGAARLIKKHKPRIIMEVWGGEMGRKYSNRAVQELQEFGYRAFTLESDGSASREVVADPVGSIPASDGARGNFLFLMK